MELFSLIPENFFYVFSGTLKSHYAGILFKIYDQYKLAPLSIEREVIIDVICDYLEERQEQSGFQEALEQELGEEFPEAAGEGRERAAFFLRQLEKYGWIMIETHNDYRQYVNLADYAIEILETLDRVRRNIKKEYQGYVYATYSLLYSEEAEKQGFLALEKAHEQTEMLLSGLKSLNHNIKRYTEKVLKKKKPKDILKVHFEQYKEEILDKSYHRLKTSDNVFKYRPRIISRVDRWAEDARRVDKIARQGKKRQAFKDLEEARQHVYRNLDFIKQAFLNMDYLLEEIDRRNSDYAATSYRQLEYILNTSQSTQGQLIEILKYLAELIRDDETELGRRDLLPEEFESLFSLFTQHFLGERSLYKARELSRNHRPEELQELQVLGEQEKAQLVEKSRVKLANRITRDKVNAYIMEKLGQRTSMKASEMGIDTLRDFLYLIYALAYSGSRRVGYRVIFEGESTVGGKGRFSFRDVMIKRKA